MDSWDIESVVAGQMSNSDDEILVMETGEDLRGTDVRMG
jgi:hypothetical protein